MVIIDVPLSAYATSDIALGGITYRVDFTFNSIDERWRLDIYRNGIEVALGLKVIEETSVIGSKYPLPDFDHGMIVCLKRFEDGLPASRNNIGIGKAYNLIYFTNEELSDVG